MSFQSVLEMALLKRGSSRSSAFLRRSKKCVEHQRWLHDTWSVSLMFTFSIIYFQWEHYYQFGFDSQSFHRATSLKKTRILPLVCAYCRTEGDLQWLGPIVYELVKNELLSEDNDLYYVNHLYFLFSKLYLFWEENCA